MSVPHRLELFVSDCPLCRRVRAMVELGKCAGCSFTVYDLSKNYNAVEDLVKRYRVRAVPTLIIDGKIKIVGIPTFTFVCDENLYHVLEQKYAFKP
ncbi:MAG: thioredoxin family protein [Candidatus Caldarchaeum sp.]